MASAVPFAVAFSIEGVTYLNEHKDATATQKAVESKERKSFLLSRNIADPAFCQLVVKDTTRKFKKIDILMNNLAQ